MTTKKAEHVADTKTEPASLKEFIDSHERAAQDAGAVVVAVASPGEEARVYPGTYSGIRVSDGKRSATYSDGSTH